MTQQKEKAPQENGISKLPKKFWWRVTVEKKSIETKPTGTAAKCKSCEPACINCDVPVPDGD